MKRPGSPTIGRWFFALLVILFLWVLATRLSEIEKLAHTLIEGRWPWVLAAVGMQVLYYVAYAYLVQAAFQVVDVSSRARELLPISLASLFINSTTPTGGTAGLALFVDDVRRRGASPVRATAGMVLVQTTHYGVFALLLVVGMEYLLTRDDLTSLEVSSAILLFLLVGGLAGVLLMGLCWPGGLRWLLQGVQGVMNRGGAWLKRPYLFPLDWAEKSANDFIAAANAIAAHPNRLYRTLFFALLAHLMNIGCLLCIFLAFRQSPDPGIILAGYTMSILFLIISPTPNGIGVVEAIVPVVYASLDMPAAISTVITLAFRGLSFWLPMLTGFFLLRQLKMFSGQEQELAEVGQVRLAAILTAWMGLVNVLSAVQPSLIIPVAPLTEVTPLIVRQGGAVTAVLMGFFLFVLSHGLWRHKRVAWGLTLAVLAMSLLTHLLHDSNYREAGLVTLLAIYLWTQRSHFHALSDVPSMWQGARVLLLATGFTLTYGTIGYYLLGEFTSQSFSLTAAWQKTLTTFTIIYAPGLQPVTGFDTFFTDSIYLVGAVTIGYAVLMLLRPVLIYAPVGDAERERVKQLIQQYGRSHLAQMFLLPGRSYFFSSGGSVIAYMVTRGLAISLGDPIGPSHDLEATLNQFRHFCTRRDWQPAFYHILPDTLAVYTAASFQTLPTGFDITVHLADFEPGDKTSPLQTIRNEFLRANYRVVIQQPPISADLLERLRLVSDEWLSENLERGFFSTRFDDDTIRQNTIAAVYTPGGRISAFAVILLVNQHLGIDLLRYRSPMKKGTLVFFVSSLLQWAKEQQGDIFHLGVKATEEKEPLARVLAVAQGRIDVFSQLDGLENLVEQAVIRPEPCYLAFPGAASLPAIWMVLSQRR